VFRRYLFLLILWIAAAVPVAAIADDEDHDRARSALEAGEVLPLEKILGRIRPAYPGEVLEVELERDDGRWLYEIKVLQPGGKLLKLKVDGRDAAVLGVRNRSSADGRTDDGTTK